MPTRVHDDGDRRNPSIMQEENVSTGPGGGQDTQGNGPNTQESQGQPTQGDQGGASESPAPDDANTDNSEPGASSTDESASGGRLGDRGPTTTESGETE